VGYRFVVTGGRKAWTRRAAIVGSGAAVVVLGVGAHHLSTAAASEPAPDLGAIAAGATIDRWRVVAVHPVRFGAIPVVLRTHQGRRYQVDIMARDPAGPPGVANTHRFSLYVANQGDGGSPTDEEEGLGAIALANALAEHEARAATLPELMTLAQRNAQHDGRAFGVPLS
jgi:hypothetical protein